MEKNVKDLFKVKNRRTGFRSGEKPFFVCLCCIFLMFLCTPVWAAEFDVTDATELQDALSSAQNNGDNDTIRVAQGTYIGNFTYEPVSGEDYDIILEGGWNPDFTSRTLDPASTILDGDFTGRVLTINNRTNDTTGSIKIEGFTIKNGLVAAPEYGGGIQAFTLPPGVVEINKNIIEDNDSDRRGGGFYVMNHVAGTGAPIIISNNIIRNNKAGSTTVSSNPFGGGAMLYSTETLTIYNNLIYGNEVRGAVSYEGSGGGLCLIGLAGDIYLINNTIVENHSNGFGGGVTAQTFSNAWANSHFQFYNNIIRGNTYGGWLGDADIFNTISNSVPSPGNTLTISHTNYSGYGAWPNPPAVTPTLTGNINLNPEFVGVGDYHLNYTSPCIDTGYNSAPQLPATDFEGDSRVIDGDNDGTPTVDMGADEYAFPCECDLNHDGTCDMEDWLEFGEDWGRTDCHEPGAEPCECDLNDDGRCDMEDWLIFGEDWGRTDCPTPQ